MTTKELFLLRARQHQDDADLLQALQSTMEEVTAAKKKSDDADAEIQKLKDEIQKLKDLNDKLLRQIKELQMQKSITSDGSGDGRESVDVIKANVESIP